MTSNENIFRKIAPSRRKGDTWVHYLRRTHNLLNTRKKRGVCAVSLALSRIWAKESDFL